MKSIPTKVLEQYKALIESFGNKVQYLGKRKGKSYYLFSFGENMITGFPEVVEYDGKEARPITGLAAVDIVSSFMPED